MNDEVKTVAGSFPNSSFIIHRSPFRLLSLDVFRGVTVAGMILVNNPGNWGAIYPALRHATWDGATPTDWIFPFFLFIVGVAIPFAQAKHEAARFDEKPAKSAQIRRILLRSAILFLLGLFLAAIPTSRSNGIFALGALRIPGVLQRIAVCYGVVAILSLFLRTRGLIATAVAAAGIYLLIMLAGPVEPKRAADGRWSKTGSVEARLDHIVFGYHNYEKPPTRDYFFDPEGTVSTLCAIGTTIFGVVIGRLLLRDGASGDFKASAVFVIGVASLVAAEVVDALGVPINKQLWTPSYVLHTGGLACLALGVCYWLVDVRQVRGAWLAPFVATGRNAILVFVLSGAVAKLMSIRLGETSVKGMIYQPMTRLFDDPRNSSLLWAVMFVGVFVAVSLLLHKRRIYVRV